MLVTKWLISQERSWRSNNRPNMKNNNLIRFVQSLVFLPVMTLSLSVNSAVSLNNTEIPQNALVQKMNIETFKTLAINQALDEEVLAREVKAKAIDAYFAERDMPMAGTGMKMVLEAEKNNLDWRLLPAIAVRESTGGKFQCKKVPNSPFGWGSCKIGFKSYDEAIEVVAKNLGGNNPNTSHHYDNKTTTQILRAYNPPSIVPKYAEQVISIMDAIGEADNETIVAINS